MSKTYSLLCVRADGSEHFGELKQSLPTFESEGVHQIVAWFEDFGPCGKMERLTELALIDMDTGERVDCVELTHAAVSFSYPR
ncbi:hypothetical protein ACI3PL_25080, partial [Lacticaseibacillus paracasei]